jgi:hypothetical protein
MSSFPEYLSNIFSHSSSYILPRFRLSSPLYSVWVGAARRPVQQRCDLYLTHTVCDPPQKRSGPNINLFVHLNLNLLFHDVHQLKKVVIQQPKLTSVQDCIVKFTIFFDTIPIQERTHRYFLFGFFFTHYFDPPFLGRSSLAFFAATGNVKP